VGWYPITLQIAGRPCVVIGGGSVAERKVAGLLGAGAAVTVVSPTLTPRLADLASARRIIHTPRAYRAGDLEGFALAFATTGAHEVNDAIAREGRERGVWVNAADDPAHCDFILPSVLRRGDLTVAVATGGSAPTLARVVREDLERHVGQDLALLAEIVAEVRRDLRVLGRPANGEAWRRALDAPLRRLVAEGRRTEARRRLLQQLGGA
jgi:precorrin-2 dehydrogenase/sirohydrochlorin ferrochelatase